MKKSPIICITALMLFAACQNSGSSTVGTYEQEETSQSSEKNESESHKKNESHPHGVPEHENADATEHDTLNAPGDTTKHEERNAEDSPIESEHKP